MIMITGSRVMVKWIVTYLILRFLISDHDDWEWGDGKVDGNLR